MTRPLDPHVPATRCENCVFWVQFDSNKLLGICKHPDYDGGVTDKYETCASHQQDADNGPPEDLTDEN